jgi:outer membrane scaffolding protein for murein synthesis (MipA/OmpV family)
LALIVGLNWCRAVAEPLPLWEAGAGGSIAYLPDYRGSIDGAFYPLPLPYLVYRGDFLRVDRGGVRAQVLDTERFDFDLSAGASVPVHSSGNRVRRGMANLRPTLELGPVASVHLWRAAERNAVLDLRLPVRTAFAIGGSDIVRDVGVVAAPALNLDLKLAAAGGRWNLGLLAAAIYGDRRYFGYYYDVAAADATVGRPTYRARGGYGGWQAIAAISRRLDRIWLGGFIKFDSVRGAVFADSPLVTKWQQVSGGIGITYIFAVSEQRVEREE